MKRFWILICALSAVGIINTSFKGLGDKNYGLANVYKLEGKYVFLYSQPFHDHDTVFTMSTMVLSQNPAKAVPSVIKKAFKEAEKRNVEFDAIITGSAQLDYAIKFKK